MATRFYLPSTGAADVEPGFSTEWLKTLEADRLKMVKTKINSAFAEKTCSEDVETVYFVLNRQYVSNPIGVHDFTDCTCRIQIRCMEDSAKADFRLQQFSLRIVSGDGQTERFVLDAIRYKAAEMEDGTLTNSDLGPIAVQSGSSQNGDRIVLEVGIRSSNSKTTLYTATMDFGDNSGTDLPENDTETAQYNPWIEFSHDIAEYEEEGAVWIPKIIMIT